MAAKATGINFFDPVAKAEDMRVNAEIAADVNLIAASSTFLGDGGNALEIAELNEQRLMNSGISTFNDFYASIVGQIGREVADSEWTGNYQNIVMERMVNQREAVSGVSIDEEMMNLIKYQLGYNAAGKLCSMVDEMLDTLMSIK